jgi:integrase/recombinase XerD
MMGSFSSAFAADLERFLAFKRGVGYRYRREEFLLRAFDRFVSARTRAGRGRCALDDLLREWLARNDNRKPISVAWECSVLRQFCEYRRRESPRAFVPSRNWTPQSTASGTFLPYVLTEADVKILLRLTASLDRPAFRAHVYRTLLLVLYCTGLRFGEALRLRLCDVDLDKGVFFVAESKGRARWVPFHRSLAREIERYILERHAYVDAPARPDDRLFVGCNRTRLPISTAHYTLCTLFRRAGLKPGSGRVGPRPTDLRHTFAGHRLERWYRERVEIHGRLPWLSAYMGHEDILGTERYLTATPRLLALAARRMRRRVAANRRGRR